MPFARRQDLPGRASSSCQGWVTTLACILALSACDQQESARAQDEIVIAVVGHGVLGEESAPGPKARAFPLNRAQGWDMWLGVQEALEALRRDENMAQNSENVLNDQQYADRIRIRRYDDLARSDEAARIARDIIRDPNILAVIGHATSGTTQAAAHIYARVNIPLLMPIATSPIVMYPPGQEDDHRSRLRNCVRLPPSDELAQAPALVYALGRAATPPLCVLVRDSSPGAEGYSSPLYKAVRDLIRPANVHWERSVNMLEARAIRDLAEALSLDPQPNTVLFCGYGSTAILFVTAMREAYKGVPVERRPILLFSDGCFVPDLDLSGFQAFLTFPVPPLQLITNGAHAERIAALIRDKLRKETSYAVYGYDAMLLLGEAIGEAAGEGTVTRDAVLAKLLGSGSARGASLPYTFKDGENVRARYYLYTSGADQADLHYESTILETDLDHVRTRG